MATIKQVVGSAQALTVTGLSTLTSASYATSSTIDCTANQPLDLMIDVLVGTSNTPSGNKQVIVWAAASYDNTNFQTAANSSEDQNLTYLGAVLFPASATNERKSFPVKVAYGGVLPPYLKIVFKNDMGVTMNAGTVTYSEISATVA